MSTLADLVQSFVIGHSGDSRGINLKEKCKRQDTDLFVTEKRKEKSRVRLLKMQHRLKVCFRVLVGKKVDHMKDYIVAAHSVKFA